ncbi:MAG: heparan-alpha-glucosaminide N-acetyltransferase domain-containing protein [Polyangiales bacterium]
MSAPKPPRDASVDLVRGAVMVLMALDHARDFFGDGRDPLDLATTTFPLFFTRWVTHFCAPVFVLLAGVSAYVGGASMRPAEASRLLLTRGLWLVVLELTVVRFGWLFNVDYRFSFVQVIWAIGWSMVALALLSRLGARACLALGAAMIAGHNLLDGVHADRLGGAGWLWHVLHQPGRLTPLEGHRVYVAYPLVPWVGVMAVGYGLGPWMERAPAERRQLILRAGAVLTAGFVSLRALNVYGDPQRWRAQPRTGFTLLSFLDCEKYPPSLLYLLMTLGPALLAWGALTGRDLARARPVVTFGRVPLFYYVLHLPLLHAMAGAWLYARGGTAAIEAAHSSRNGSGGSLPVVYAAWALGVALLWPLCRWFDGVKTRHRGAWWTKYT